MQAKIGPRLLKTLQLGGKPCDVTDTEIAGFTLRMGPSGVGSYSIMYRTKDGRKARYTIGDTRTWTAAQARDEALRIRSQINLGSDPSEDKRAGRANSLREFLDDHYIPWMVANRKTGAGQVARIKAGFPHLLDKPLAEITAWALEKHMAARLKRGKIKPATLNKDTYALRSALNRAVDWHVLPENPLLKVKRMREAGGAKVRYLTPDEEERLLQALRDRDLEIRTGRDSFNLWARQRGYNERRDLSKLAYADHLLPMVLLSLHTGLRRGELFGLQWADVDLKERAITVRGEIAKTLKTRVLPLNDIAYDVLANWRSQSPDDGLVFPSPRTGDILNNTRKAWLAVLKRAGIAAFRWHDMRHHFASKLVQSGVNLYIVSRLLGHSTVTTTEKHYAHLAPAQFVDAVARLVPGQTNVVPFAKAAEQT